MADNKQIQVRTDKLIERAMDRVPFLAEFIRKISEDQYLIDGQWQDCYGDALMKKRIAKKACLLATEKFWAAARDQAREELKNEKKANIDNRAS